jgi:hypothetical protein
LGILQRSLAETRQQIAAITAAIDSIGRDVGCEQYPAVLRMWYIERLPKEEIAEKLNYSASSRASIYSLKQAAIKKFAVTIFGVAALKAT